MVFVIDNSGSMGGPSMAQAKASLIYALDRLDPADRFNVIRFDDTMDVFFPDVVAADREHVTAAKTLVSNLEATGGTEMIPPLRAALRDATPDAKDTLRQVIFLTDGAIGNEQEMFNTLTAHARPLARVHGRHRLGAQLLSDDASGGTRARHLHQYRIGRAGRGPHARTLRQAREPGRHRHEGRLRPGASGSHARPPARRLSRRAGDAD